MKAKVLILEKDVEARNLLKTYMETKAYEVFCVDTLREAVWKVREVDPHVILVGQSADTPQARAVARLQQVSDSRIVAVSIAEELLRTMLGTQNAEAQPSEQPRSVPIPVFHPADSNSSAVPHPPPARPAPHQRPAEEPPARHPASGKRPNTG